MTGDEAETRRKRGGEDLFEKSSSPDPTSKTLLMKDFEVSCRQICPGFGLRKY